MAAIDLPIEFLVLLVPLFLFAFWAWMLVDCVRSKSLKPEEKTAWFLVIFFCPIAAWIYSLLLRKKKDGPFVRLTERIGL